MIRASDREGSISTPSLDDFSFFGFDGLMPRIERNLQHAEIRSGEPGVKVFEEAVYVPAEHSGLQQRQRGMLVRNFARPDRGSVEPTATITEEVVYLGWLFSHYGHFLTQSLARTWFLPQVDPSIKVIFHHPSPAWWEPTGPVLQILEVFGVPHERILTLDAPTRIRRMIVPEPLFEPRSIAEDRTVRAHAAMALPYQAVAERIAGDVKPSSQPVYLSRRLLSSSQRSIIGEGALEELLEANGFRIAHPQTMSFEDQVRLVNDHEEILSTAGSAVHNAWFSLHRPRLHLLTNGHRFSPDYFLLSPLVGAATSFINCLGTSGRRDFPRAFKFAPQMLDASACIAYLDQHGFLTKPVPADQFEHAPELQAQYDQVWLYGYVRGVGSRRELPADVEQVGLRLASSSWPVSLALAWYSTANEPARVDGLARQFATLVAAERQPDRLEHYRGDVEEMAPAVVRMSEPDTAKVLMDVLAERFRIDVKLSG
jgi:hypothetical protein